MPIFYFPLKNFSVSFRSNDWLGPEPFAQDNLEVIATMRVNNETLQIKISKLRQLVAECPTPGNVREEIKEILKVAPDMLQMAENALQSNNPLVLDHIGEAQKRSKSILSGQLERSKEKEPPNLSKREQVPTLIFQQLIVLITG